MWSAAKVAQDALEFDGLHLDVTRIAVELAQRSHREGDVGASAEHGEHNAADDGLILARGGVRDYEVIVRLYELAGRVATHGR